MARSIQSVQRAAAVLRLLATGERSLGLSRIASALGLAKATTHGLLRTLQEEGLVEQDPRSGAYRLGPELLRLGTGYLDTHELRARALGAAAELARASGEEAYVGVPHRRGVLVVHHAPRPGDGRPGTEVGSMRPLHSTALGKALAAFDPAARAEALAAGLTAVTPRTVTDAAAFAAALAGVRGRGWACDVGETWEGVASVAAPVFGHRRVLVGAVGVAGAVERVLTGAEPHPRLVASVRDCARSVSHELGAGRF